MLREDLLKNKLFEDEAARFKASNPQFDPLTILTLISILVSLAQLLYECRKKSGEIKALLGFDSTKRQVRTVVRKELGFMKFMTHGKAMVDAILDYGVKVDGGHLQTLIDEVKK